MFTQEATRTLDDVTRERLERKIANSAPNAQKAVDRLISEAKISNDFIAPIGVNLRRADKTPTVTFSSNGSVKMHLNEENYSLHPNAIGQLSAKLNIPSRYLVDLANGDDWQKALCQEILNKHSSWTERSRVLVRSVGDQVRGVLSDQYRRMNSQDLVSSFISSGYSQGATLIDGHMSDTKLFVEMIMPEPVSILTPKNGNVLMGFGARISTSDYGDGALEIRAFNIQGVCLNGMVRESVMRSVHLGSKLPDNLALSERTYRLDTATQVSAIRDLTLKMFSPDFIMQQAEDIQDASYIEVDLEKEIKALPKIGMTKGESEEVGKILMQNKVDDGVSGEATLWKLVNGVTAYSRNVDATRAREIHEMAGKLMDRVKSKK